MSPESKQRRATILQADDKSQYAAVDLLSLSYLEEFPHDANIWLRRGRTLTQLCRYSEADVAFEAASQNADDELMSLVWSSKAQSYMRRGQFLQAEFCYEQANTLWPKQTWILIPFAHTAWMRGDLQLAEARFREAVAIEDEDQDRDEALFNLGGILVALGKLDEAAHCYRQSISLDPDFEPAQARLEDVERALEIQNTLLRSNKDSS